MKALFSPELKRVLGGYTPATIDCSSEIKLPAEGGVYRYLIIGEARLQWVPMFGLGADMWHKMWVARVQCNSDEVEGISMSSSAACNNAVARCKQKLGF